MVAHAARRAAVQRLPAVARQYDIKGIPDSSGKEKVLEWSRRILGEELEDDDRVEAEAALKEFNATWPEEAAAPTQGKQKSQEWFFNALQILGNHRESQRILRNPRESQRILGNPRQSWGIIKNHRESQ